MVRMYLSVLFTIGSVQPMEDSLATKALTALGKQETFVPQFFDYYNNVPIDLKEKLAEVLDQKISDNSLLFTYAKQNKKFPQELLAIFVQHPETIVRNWSSGKVLVEQLPESIRSENFSESVFEYLVGAPTKVTKSIIDFGQPWWEITFKDSKQSYSTHGVSQTFIVPNQSSSLSLRSAYWLLLGIERLLVTEIVLFEHSFSTWHLAYASNNEHCQRLIDYSQMLVGIYNEGNKIGDAALLKRATYVRKLLSCYYTKVSKYIVE